MSRISGDLYVDGFLSSATMRVPNATITNAGIAADAAIARSKLAQDALKAYPIPLTDWLVHDAPASKLPTTPGNDDLGLIIGTLGTDAITVQSGDCKAATVSRYARFLKALPAEYDAGQTVAIRFAAAMLTTIADVQAILDIFVYAYDRESGISADLCGTAFANINSLTWDDYDFSIDSTALAPGIILDTKVYVYVEDAATATAVKACIGAAELLCDVRG